MQPNLLNVLPSGFYQKPPESRLHHTNTCSTSIEIATLQMDDYLLYICCLLTATIG